MTSGEPQQLEWLKGKIRRRENWNRAVETAQRLAVTVRPRWPHDAQKFLDLDHWLDVNLRRAFKLGLHKTAGLDVLDLGCGTGLFLVACEALGHTAFGVDLPSDELESPEREIFTAMPDAFGVRVSRMAIRSFERLQVPGPFDLIASFMVCFNNHKQPDEWIRGDWEYFVNDMLRLLKPGGRLALRLNHHEEKFGTRGYFDEDTREFFVSVGTESDGKILITSPG